MERWQFLNSPHTWSREMTAIISSLFSTSALLGYIALSRLSVSMPFSDSHAFICITLLGFSIPVKCCILAVSLSLECLSNAIAFSTTAISRAIPLSLISWSSQNSSHTKSGTGNFDIRHSQPYLLQLYHLHTYGWNGLRPISTLSTPYR